MKKEDIIELVKDNLPSTIDLSKFQYIKTEDIGYFGRVSSKDYISYSNLCDQLDFHKGILMDDNGWLVFWYKGSVLFISQHPIRYKLSWDSLYKHNLVFGERNVVINNNTYNVMLPTGGNKEDNGIGSMWNDLIYKVHKEYGRWDMLSDKDLNIDWVKCSVGGGSWCQESCDDYKSFHTYRGYFSLESLNTNSSLFADTYIGARLVLKKDYK